jgi:hypothetical protein
MRPSTRRRSAFITAPIALLTVLGTAAPAANARTSGLSSWAAPYSQVFGFGDSGSPETTASGRLWQLSFDRPARPVLRWRRMSDGHASSRPVAIPHGGALRSQITDDGRNAQLFIAGDRAFFSGDWCSAEDDEGSCEDIRGIYAQFSIRTGKVLRLTTPKVAPVLVGGTRVTYVVRRAHGQVLLRDAITRRLVRRLPRDSREIQGAGTFVAWKDPDAYERKYGHGGDVGPDFDAVHVAERATGRQVYDLRRSALRDAVQPRGHVQADDTLLQDDGSLAINVSLDEGDPFRPVAIDRNGTIQRVTRRPLRGPIQFGTSVRSGRVLLDVSDNELRCGGYWLTEFGGRRGNTLRSLPRTKGYKISQVPLFQGTTAIGWLEDPNGREDPDETSDRTRFRVASDFRSIPLSTNQRPRC